MVDVAQLVRVTDCGSEGRGFESHLPPKEQTKQKGVEFSTPFVFIVYGANLFADIDYENKVVDCQLSAECSSLEAPPRRADGKDERSAVNPIFHTKCTTSKKVPNFSTPFLDCYSPC